MASINWYTASYKFSGCSGLAYITIPKSVTGIYGGAFSGCTSLNHVEFNAQKCIYCGIYYSTVFPSTIKTVTIGDEVEAIPEYAFYGCTGLTSVTIGNRVTSIGKDAFYECTGLTSITIPNSVTSIGENAFSGCKNLISISISNSLTSIEVGTFQDCRGLTSFSIPNSVGSIGSDAFYGCTGLKELIIQDGNSPLSIARCRRGLDGMFEHCPLKVLYLGRDISYSIDDYDSPFYENTLTSVIISNSVTKICSSYNPKNQTIKLFGTSPAKVIWLTNTPPPGNIIAEGKVNYVANDLYTKLNNQTVYPYLSSMFEVNAIKYVPVSPSERTCDVIDCNYYEMKEDIVIDKTVSYKGVTMTVKNIHPYAMYEVRGLETLTLSNQGYIGDYAFANSEIKKKLNINNTVTGIGNYAYNNCIGLPYATIDLRGKIGNNAFQNCKDLSIAGIGGQVTSIGDSAFYSCTELKWIDIANSVKSIGKCSFAQCKKLTSAKIGTGIRSIQKYAFYACSSLSEIQVGNYVQTIGNYAFSDCSTLPTIIIPKTVESIDNYAFRGCKSLKYVIMEDKDSELKLGSNGSDPLFADCPLDSIYIGRNISYSTESSKGYLLFIATLSSGA